MRPNRAPWRCSEVLVTNGRIAHERKLEGTSKNPAEPANTVGTVALFKLCVRVELPHEYTEKGRVPPALQRGRVRIQMTNGANIGPHGRMRQKSHALFNRA